MPLIYAAIEPVKGMQKATNFTSASGELPMVVHLGCSMFERKEALESFIQDLVSREPGLPKDIPYPIRIYYVEIGKEDYKMIEKKIEERHDALRKDDKRLVRCRIYGEFNVPRSVFTDSDHSQPSYHNNYLISFLLKASNVRIVGCFEYIPSDEKSHTLIINSKYTNQKAVTTFTRSVQLAFSVKKTENSEFIDTGIQVLKPASQAIMQLVDDKKTIVADSKSNVVILEQPQQPASTLVDNKAVVTTSMAKSSSVIDPLLPSEQTQAKDSGFKSKMALVAGCTLAGYETFGFYGAAELIASVVATQQISESTQTTVVKKK